MFLFFFSIYIDLIYGLYLIFLHPKHRRFQQYCMFHVLSYACTSILYQGKIKNNKKKKDIFSAIFTQSDLFKFSGNLGISKSQKHALFVWKATHVHYSAQHVIQLSALASYQWNDYSPCSLKTSPNPFLYFVPLPNLQWIHT